MPLRVVEVGKSLQDAPVNRDHRLELIAQGRQGPKVAVAKVLTLRPHVHEVIQTENGDQHPCRGEWEDPRRCALFLTCRRGGGLWDFRSTARSRIVRHDSSLNPEFREFSPVLAEYTPISRHCRTCAPLVIPSAAEDSCTESV